MSFDPTTSPAYLPNMIMARAVVAPEGSAFAGQPTILALRTSSADGYGLYDESRRFQWPAQIGAMAVAHDWRPQAQCGYGLHGIAFGMGDASLLKTPDGCRWDIIRYLASEVVFIDHGAKVKGPRAEMVHVGHDQAAALAILREARVAVVLAGWVGSGDGPVTASATGDSGNASATGYRGNASATGNSGNASATGYRGNASATGDSGNASATGDSGNASATGYSGNASATGNSGNASATGDRGNASATGYRGNASATGDSGNASATGDRGNASATGDSGNASATGYSGNASATGNSGNASATGYRGNASATGYRGNASATGKFSVAYGEKVAAGEGGYIVCRYGPWNDYKFKGANVGAKLKIKPYRWYTYDGKKWIDHGPVADGLLPPDVVAARATK